MTDSELVEEAARLAEQKDRTRCDEIRLALVQDELESRGATHSDEHGTARRHQR
ncbi:MULTISPECIES: hypothetical protein [Rhodococcus]|uniref:hypothetical protein n=1 Tax=Rhodococcus TaxID=1827 RepID=UPI00159EF531|nr:MULTISPECIES: hypothetical protein [Rhodococcus]